MRMVAGFLFVVLGLAAPASAQRAYVVVDAPSRSPEATEQHLIDDLRAAYPDIVFVSAYAASVEDERALREARRERRVLNLRLSLRVRDGTATIRGVLSASRIEHTCLVEDARALLLQTSRELVDGIPTFPHLPRRGRARARRRDDRVSGPPVIDPWGGGAVTVPDEPRPPLRWRRNGAL